MQTSSPANQKLARSNPPDAAPLYGAASALSLGALLAIVSLFVFRRGLGDSLAAVSALYVLAILPIWTSVGVVSRFGRGTLSFATAIVSGFFVGILLPLLGLVAAVSVVPLACAIVALILADGHRQLWAVLYGGKRALLAWAILCAILLVIFTETFRLFLPETMLLGTAIPDRFYHASIAQMIAHYGSVSMGADGLAYRHYHFLSHAIAAGSANASGASVPLVYLYWGAFALKLQIVWAVLLAGVFFSHTGGGLGASITARLAYAWMVVILIGGLESESFVLGTAMCCALLPLLLTLTETTPRDRGYFPALMLAVAATLVVAAAKVSSGFFGVLALLVILWRSRHEARAVGLIIVSLGVIGYIGSRFLVEQDLSSKGYPIAILVLDYIHYFNWTTFFNYALPLLVLLLLASRGQASFTVQSDAVEFNFGQRLPLPFAGRWSFAGTLRLLTRADGITQFLLLSILACLAVLVLQRIGANNQFFSSTIYGFAFLLLPFAVSRAFDTAPSPRTIAWWMGAVTGLTILCQSVLFLFQDVTGLPHVIVALYQSSTSDYQKGEAVADMRAALKRDHTLFTGLRARVDASPITRLTADLAAKNFDGKLAVNIPPRADEVWRRLNLTSWWCFTGHMVVPAVAGIVEVRSIEPERIENQCLIPGTLPYYGFAQQQSKHRTSDFTPAQLCTLAEPLGVKRIYRLNSYKFLSQNSVITCK